MVLEDDDTRHALYEKVMSIAPGLQKRHDQSSFTD